MTVAGIIIIGFGKKIKTILPFFRAPFFSEKSGGLECADAIKSFRTRKTCMGTHARARQGQKWNP